MFVPVEDMKSVHKRTDRSICKNLKRIPSDHLGFVVEMKGSWAAGLPVLLSRHPLFRQIVTGLPKRALFWVEVLKSRESDVWLLLVGCLKTKKFLPPST